MDAAYRMLIGVCDPMMCPGSGLHTSQGPTSPQDMLGTNLGESLRTVFAEYDNFDISFSFFFSFLFFGAVWTIP